MTPFPADDSGAVTDRIEYSPYGMTTYRKGSTDTPFLFNGRYGVQTDPNGLLYMRARYYSPYLCRFLNPDPAGFSGGGNFYAFADGNPISMMDPFGLGAVGEGGVKSWLQHNVVWPGEATADALLNFGLGVLFTPPGMPTPQFNPIQNVTEWATGHPAYEPSQVGSALQRTASDLAPAGQDLLLSLGGPSKSDYDLADAANARNELMLQYGRQSATYIGGTKNGIVTTGKSGSGAGAEDYVASVLGSDGRFTSAYGWRTPEEGAFRPIPVCVRCQGKYGSPQFPLNVQYKPGGKWSRP